MQSQDNQKKYKKEIIAVIAVAAVCIIVALTFVIQYAVRTYKEEKMIEQLSKSMSDKLNDNAKKSDELKSSVNSSLVGTYYSKGDLSDKDENNSIAVMQLLPDGKVKAKTFSDVEHDGWWTSSQKSGIELLAVGLSEKSAVSIYQVSGSYIMDTKSVYFGEIEKAPFFNTTLINESPLGKLTLELDETGRAEGEFIDTNEKSENYGLTYALRGSYTKDGDFIDIVLNSAKTRFLTFDYNSDEIDKDSGMASIYFEKTNEA